MQQWEIFKANNPKARMVCIDVVPNATRQAPTRPDIINIGGFSDNVFTLIDRFVKGLTGDVWLKEIEAIDLDQPSETQDPTASV